jgi:short-subunit dehydrogenase
MVIILTGGSSGIGKTTAEVLSAQHTVYELSRHGVDNGTVHHIDCDVTNPDACKAAVEQVLKNEGRVDVLISNAGMGIAGAIEFTPLAEAKRQFDVNFFGAMNITQAVLPVMRRLRKGRIIYVPSMTAVFSIPFQALYSASKAALTSFAMGLYNEVRPFGIEVCALLPGDVSTGFSDARKTDLVGADVYTHMQQAISTMEKDERGGQTTMQLARKIQSMVNAKSPAVYTTEGFQYHLFLLLNRIVPTSWAWKIVGWMY